MLRKSGPAQQTSCASSTLAHGQNLIWLSRETQSRKSAPFTWCRRRLGSCRSGFFSRCVYRTRLCGWLSRVSHVLPPLCEWKVVVLTQPRNLFAAVIIRLISAGTTHSVRCGRWETWSSQRRRIKTWRMFILFFSLLLKLIITLTRCNHSLSLL